MQLLEHFKELTVHPKNAKELKGLILQLAIQGKLTQKWRAQNPKVEPAAVLLEKIKEEKAQLIKDKKIKKEKPLSEITAKEIPYQLPDGWVWCRLGDIITFLNGYAFKSTTYIEKSKFQVIRLGNVKNDNFLINTKEAFVPETVAAKALDYILLEDDILTTLTGTKGKRDYCFTCLVKANDIVERTLLLNQRVGCIRPIDRSSAEIMNKFLKSDIIITQLFATESGTANQGNIGSTAFKNLFYPLPPLEEQKAIVSAVNQLFKEVEALETQTQARVQLKEDFVTSALRQLTEASAAQNQNGTSQQWDFLKPHFKTFFTSKEAVKKLRETILQLAVQGKLTTHWRTQNTEVESASVLLDKIKAEKAQLIKDKKIKKEKPLPEITAEEIPYELPDGWVWCRMQEIGLFERGKSKHRPRNDFRLFEDGKYPLVQTGDVAGAKKTGGIITTHKSAYNEFGLEQSRMWNKGTLCITIAANIAETGTLGFDACFPDSVVGFSELLRGNSAKYVECFITIMKSDLERFAPSTAQKNINLGILYELKFPLPPLEEQKAIVAKVNSLMALCEQLEQEIAQNTQQVEDLMQSCLREVVR